MKVALRIARRSVRRNLARSVLVIALIAVPVAGVTIVDGLVRTMTDRDVDVDRAMGTADVRVDVTARRASDVERLLPAGSRSVRFGERYLGGGLRLAVGDRLVRTHLDLVVVDDPLTAHLALLSSGRWPKGPGEALVTKPLAERLGLLDGDRLRSGATLTAVDGSEVAVTGLAENPYHLDREAVVARPGSLLQNAMLGGSSHPLGYLVDLPDDVDAAAFARAWPDPDNRVTTRESFVDTTPVGGYLVDASSGPVALFAGLGLVGIVLVAGAAFAVGARRQVRELGLVAANGGTATHVWRIMLAQGLVLGVLGAATGLLLGAAATVLGTPLWEQVTGQVMTHLRFGWLDLAVVATVGVLASVMAAVVPAPGVARMSPVDALTGRFRTTPPRARRSMLGVILLAVGVFCVVGAGLVGRGWVTAYEQRVARSDEYAFPVDLSLITDAIVVGAVLVLAGLTLVAPAVLTAVGRFGGRLPLSGRLAVRDAVRHRRRTVAAVVAVVVTVAGSVAAAFVLSAQANASTKSLPERVVLAHLGATSVESEDPSPELENGARFMTEAVPGAVAHEVTMATERPEGARSTGLSALGSGNCFGAQLGVGDPELIELSTGRPPDADVRTALAAGQVVVYDDCLLTPSGTVRFESNVELPAYLATREGRSDQYSPNLPGMFISEEALAERGWGTYANAVAVRYPAGADTDALYAAAVDAGLDTYFDVPLSDQFTVLYLILAGVAAVIALFCAGVTVSLSAAEGRSDLATLAALGAQPLRRRTLAGAQALVITVLGTLGGLVLGGLVGYAAVPVLGLLVLAVPWQHLVLTAVGVPLLSAAAAVLSTRSRLPMTVRRQS
ncbi:ABC transporter permease [Actinophytocola sp.]|uniref:ABC transporter permease n=1 Tax=Actinophytocola sp. TaxID=1872138 RepID=UPI002ED53079